MIQPHSLVLKTAPKDALSASPVSRDNASSLNFVFRNYHLSVFVTQIPAIVPRTQPNKVGSSLWQNVIINVDGYSLFVLLLFPDLAIHNYL